MGSPFIRFRRGGPEPIGRGNRDHIRSDLTLHIIAKLHRFGNLSKVKNNESFPTEKNEQKSRENGIKWDTFSKRPMMDYWLSRYFFGESPNRFWKIL